jgi:hypothetical protein
MAPHVSPRKKKPQKRKPDESTASPAKRTKTTGSPACNPGQGTSATARNDTRDNPLGLIWDSFNFSCAYDSLFVPLTFLLRDNYVIWAHRLTAMHPILGVWVLTLRQSPDNPEVARDSVRRILHHQAPESFPIGRRGLQLDVLYMALSNRITYASAIASCMLCHSTLPGEICVLSQLVHVYHVRSLHEAHPAGFPLSKWLEHNFSKHSGSCPNCRSNGVNRRTNLITTIFDIPPILFVTVSADCLILDPELTFNTLSGQKKLRLRGVVYFEQTTPEMGHFTSISIDANGKTWFHDGITTRRTYVGGPLIQDISPTNLRKRGSSSLCTAIYAEHG